MKKELPALKNENTLGRVLTDGMTQHEVAEALQISRSKVDTIEKLALRKLKVRINRMYKKEDLL
jgi:DNA-directed RNA polymerase sigma subunit (sigma70/sigma32)